MLQYPEGTQVFRPRDPARILHGVLGTRLDASARNRIVSLRAPDGPTTSAHPHGLVHFDPALRPNAQQIVDSCAELVDALGEETTDCSICRRVPTFWNTAARCADGKRLMSEIGRLHHYRDNVLPWLSGLPVDPARLHWGQHVVVRTVDGERPGIVSPIDDEGVWHDIADDGLILLRHRDGTPPTRYRAHLVFHSP
ncbi:hypothetical protein [Streptomyces sp. NPDC094031]|uniref:hypothetical protein n=1 Tax=Streptomyces sp. NPDC094031 TaxID=3155307 RepID=UPI00333049AB